MKKLIATLLFLTFAVSTIACGAAEAATSRYPSVVIGLTEQIAALDPADPNAGCKPHIGWEIYESLFDIDGFGGEMYPVLARELTKVDALHYDVTIYDYIKDSAGNELKASAVVFSFRLAYDSGKNNVLSKYMESVEALDEYTVRFTWKAEPLSVGDLEAMIAKTWVFTQAAYENSPDGFATKPIATGPYVVTNFVAGSSVTMEANENYWQTEESLVARQHQRNVQTIRFDTIAESAQMVTALQTGRIDYADNISSSNLPDFMEGGRYADSFSIDSYLDNQVYFLTPNCSANSPCSDINLRLALYYAVDNSQLCKALNSDARVVSTFCNPNYPEYSDAFASQENYITTSDVNLAKEYLAKSCYNGSTLKILLQNSENEQSMAQILQLIWDQYLNVKVEFLTYDRATVKEYKEYNDMWDLCLETRGSTDYAITFLKGMFDEGTRHTAMWVDGDEELRSLASQLQTVEGHNAEVYAKFHDHVVANAYEMPILSIYKYGVYAKSLARIIKTAKNYILPGGCTYTQK